MADASQVFSLLKDISHSVECILHFLLKNLLLLTRDLFLYAYRAHDI